MSRKSSGLYPIGLAFDAVVIDLARRTGRLSQYHRLLETENRRSGNRAITRDSTA